MGKEKEKVLKGKSLWDELKGKKDEAKNVLDVEIFGVKGEITVVFRDADVIQEIEEYYNEKTPPKPQLNLDGLKEPIEIPSKDYPKFNNHPKAKEWSKKVKPINKEKIFRIAYEYIIDEEKPADNPEDGVKLLMEAIRFMDAVDIMNEGMALSGFKERIEEAKNDF